MTTAFGDTYHYSRFAHFSGIEFKMKVIGLTTHHDSNVAVSVDGEIKVALELERLTRIRYYPSPPSKKDFIAVWTEAIKLVTDFTGIHHFDVCVSNFVGRAQLEILKTLINADKWTEVDHHDSHAAIGFYDSPFNSALVFASDGMGNTTSFEIFTATREQGLTSLARHPNTLGDTYLYIAAMIPEVIGDHYPNHPDYLPEGIHTDAEVKKNLQRLLAMPGKKMGYAPLGKPRKEWFRPMEEVYSMALLPRSIHYTLNAKCGFKTFPVKDKAMARDLAASSQYWFCLKHCNAIGKALEEYVANTTNPPIDGIVLSGGCALNVGMTQLVIEKFGLPVHVPCATGDPGIGAGACWLIEPPKKFTELMYIGLPLFDNDSVDTVAKDRGARKVTVSEIADLLMQRHIVGVVRGRSEFGPRALGHRSLLAYPDRADQLERVNKLKRRQFYRPACPSVTEEAAVKMFKGRKNSDRIVSHEDYLDLYSRDDRFSNLASPDKVTSLFPDEKDPSNFLPRSPYMSFAPFLRDECRKMFPAICHYDNTARLQTVSKESEPWFHALLREIGKRNGGYDILINTSFNIKGEPILNRLSDALEVMDNQSDGLLPYVVCEDWLFTAKTQENAKLAGQNCLPTSPPTTKRGRYECT